MTDLITMLEEPANTMGNVRNTTLGMADWYSKGVSSPCGYAACVMGEQALVGNTKVFEADKPDRWQDVLSVANRLARELEIATHTFSVEECCNIQVLPRALYSSCSHDRRMFAKNTRLFTEEELQSPHLVNENPTPKEAKDFIELCIAKLDEIIA